LQHSEERVLGASPLIDKVDINLNQNLNKLNNQNITQSQRLAEISRDASPDESKIKTKL
jgi:hypothetical protein